MGSRWCPSCGAEYVAGVRECVDCAVELVDERPMRVEDVGEGGEEQLAYELEVLDGDSRLLVDRLLTGEDIPHAWQGATVVVRAVDEAAVDAIMEQVDATNAPPPPLDPDAEQVVYEIGDWPDGQREELRDTLTAAGIAHEFDEVGDLVVLESDDERVEAMLDALEYPDALPVASDGDGTGVEDADGDGDGADDGDEGLAAQDAMSDLFVAADRLMHDAQDAEGVLSLVDAAARAETLPLPFGFSPALWGDIVGQATALRDALAGDDADDELLMDQARDLRTLLRQYV